MIITVTLNPALDKTVYVSRLTINGVNRVINTRLDSGGKGINVSKVVKALGGDTLAMGILGGESGMYIQHQLSELNVNSHFCFVDTPTRTNIKVVDTTLNSETDINERGNVVSEEVLDKLFQELISRVSEDDIVVIAGANPPGTRKNLLAEWTEALNAKGAKVCLDTTGDAIRLAIPKGIFMIKPNKAELEDICGRRLYFDIDVISAAKELISMGTQCVVVSMGPEGAAFITNDQVIRAYAPKVKALGATGAGDSMMAAMAYFYSLGYSWKDTFRYAVATSTAHVLHPGTECAAREEVETFVPQVRMDELF